MLEIIELEHTDYRYRIEVTKTCMRAIGAELFSQIDYSNFKGKIFASESQCHYIQAYSRFHHDMLNIQEHEVEKKNRLG